MTSLLVIDDEPLVLETIQLAFPDYEVTACSDAQSGIDAFLNATPDVVVCDIRLPDMSGLELFEKLHRGDSKVPIILMTGYGTAGTAIEATLRGAFEYVLKPLDPDTLIPIIENAVETSRMMRVPAVLPDDLLTTNRTIYRGRADWAVPSNARCLSIGRTRRTAGRHRADSRRKRNGQGSDRAGDL